MFRLNINIVTVFLIIFVLHKGTPTGKKLLDRYVRTRPPFQEEFTQTLNHCKLAIYFVFGEGKNAYENALHAILNLYYAREYYDSFFQFLNADDIKCPIEFCYDKPIRDKCELEILDVFGSTPYEYMAGCAMNALEIAFYFIRDLDVQESEKEYAKLYFKSILENFKINPDRLNEDNEIVQFMGPSTFCSNIASRRIKIFPPQRRQEVEIGESSKRQRLNTNKSSNERA